jgi:hypothetical protein
VSASADSAKEIKDTTGVSPWSFIKHFAFAATPIYLVTLFPVCPLLVFQR